MPTAYDRRLLQRTDLIAVLDLDESAVQQLIDTQQIEPIRICGQERFDSKDVFQLIESYKLTQGRKN